MRVLCVTGNCDRPETETFVGLKNRGVDLDVICEPDATYFDYLIESGVKVHSLTIKGRIDLKTIALIRRLLIDGRVDILHGFNNKAISNGLLAAVNLPVRVVAYRGTVGNVSFFNPGAWMTYLNPRINKVVCLSNAVLNYFLHIKFLFFYLDPSKFITIYKGHRVEWYRNAPADLTKFGIHNDAFVIVCVANYRRHKGIEVLIDAAKYLESTPQIHFLIVGRVENKSLFDRVSKLGLNSHIHFTGYQANATELVAASKLFVYPVIRREGLGKVLIEAMAQGITPITTNVGGPPEIVDRDCGIIVPPGDSRAVANAIRYFFENPSELKKTGENARERIRRVFNIDRTIDETYALYCDLMD
jgi:glycosyltransferase involved in cell wall biosynthesis